MRLHHQPGESVTQPAWVTCQEQSWCLITCSELLPCCVPLSLLRMGWIRTQNGRKDCISKQLSVLSRSLLPRTRKTRVLGRVEGSVSCGCQPQGKAELGEHGDSLSRRLGEGQNRGRGEALPRPHPLLGPPNPTGAQPFSQHAQV